MNRYFLGIDQGTTGTTALLIDESWNVVAAKNVEHTQIYPKPGWVEHDPLEIWGAIRRAVADAMMAVGVLPCQVVSIGIDNQGETCMVWNKRTGMPVYNALVWQDRRTAEYADELNEKYGDMIREKTGLGPDAYFSATKLRWILDNVEGVREQRRDHGRNHGLLSDLAFDRRRCICHRSQHSFPNHDVQSENTGLGSGTAGSF